MWRGRRRRKEELPYHSDWVLHVISPYHIPTQSKITEAQQSQTLNPQDKTQNSRKSCKARRAIMIVIKSKPHPLQYNISRSSILSSYLHLPIDHPLPSLPISGPPSPSVRKSQSAALHNNALARSDGPLALVVAITRVGWRHLCEGGSIGLEKKKKRGFFRKSRIFGGRGAMMCLCGEWKGSSFRFVGWGGFYGGGYGVGLPAKDMVV